MTKKTEKLYHELQSLIADKCMSIKGVDYFDLLEELASHIQCLIDCYKDEHREDFE